MLTIQIFTRHEQFGVWGENDPYLGVDCDVVEPPPEGAMKGKKSVTFQKLWTVKCKTKDFK